MLHVKHPPISTEEGHRLGVSELGVSELGVADQTSLRYDGWRIVAVCFVVATFGWAFGFYGQSVYLAELHRQHGWSASLISAATTFFYLFGALLVVFVAESIKRIGPRNWLLAGTSAMAVAVVLMGQANAPWQLYLADFVLAFGWAGTSLATISTTLGLWFDRKRGILAALLFQLNARALGSV